MTTVRITRYRRKILMKGVKDYLKIRLQEIRKYYPDSEYIEIGMDPDHIHLHMAIPPKYSVGKVAGTIKTNTSKLLREKFSFLDKVYWDDKGIWGKGYFVSAVATNEEMIKKYVELQGKEDAGQAELEL